MSNAGPVILYLDNTELYGSLKKAIKHYLTGGTGGVRSKFLDYLKKLQDSGGVVVLTSELAEFEAIRRLLTDFPELTFNKALEAWMELRGRYDIRSIDLRDCKTINLDLKFFQKTGFDYKDGMHYSVAKKYGAFIVTGDGKFGETAEQVYKGKVLRRGDVYQKFK
ncbi:MAG: hypothetical protein V1921_02605 [Candidatus Altiarchaeota archaeon]